MRRMRLSAAMVAAAVVSGTLALASPASADPTPAGTFRQLVGVGSDTTQDVTNALAGDTVNGTSYSATGVKSVNGAGIASYDAIEPSTGALGTKITTRTGGTTFLRPNGSGAGRTALSESLTGDLDSTGASVKGQVDFARSSGGPSSSGTSLTYIPMARDAVGVAVKGSGLDTLTVQQLHDIYIGHLTVVNGQTVHPKIPQSGSGTRKFFLNAIGVADIDVPVSIGVVQENQANAALTEDGALVPFSVGSWIAQNNGVSPDYSKTAAAAGGHLASVQLPGDDGATSPVTTVNGKLAPVNAYYENATFGRDVYNVVPSRAIDPTSIFYDKDLYDVFVTSGSHTAQLASDTAESVIAKFGFVNEPYNGSISVAKHAKLGGLEESSSFDHSVPNAPALKSTLGDASLKIGWTPNSIVPAMPVTDYRITLTDADGGLVATKDVAASTTSYSFTGLATGTYTATVTANNVNGTGTAASWTGAVKYASTTKATTATTAYGTTPKVAVTVTGTHGVVPSGKVTVKDGSTVVGTGTLNSSGKVTVNVSNHLKVATHSLTVSYAGATKLNASSATVSLKITKANPTVTKTAPATIGHTARAKVTVKVTATGTTPTGTVRIYEGSRIIATGTLSGGKVTLTLPRLSRGTHTLHAYYAGSTTVNTKSGANFTIKST
ncbi:Fibronectin type III domain-containing protein [Streptomyces sp. 3213]|uniref:Ig-like domain repeat protein n=1 Tax=Streptomyces sp. 3213.3 TaxID=1855348 RepID=UPI00089C7BA4|nr:Ig-like domain repeat protein [Streptomyces sp. 3213.3]SED95120.1 Fibronectin type III domain-containing protein [Streptomyces sp. 3213] [Streptomyces sp. 3213.3]